MRKKRGRGVLHTKKKKAKSSVDDWKPAVTSYTLTVLVPTSPADCVPSLHISLVSSCSKAIFHIKKYKTPHTEFERSLISPDFGNQTLRGCLTAALLVPRALRFVDDCLELALLGRQRRMETEVEVCVRVCEGVVSPRKAPSWRSRRPGNCY